MKKYIPLTAVFIFGLNMAGVALAQSSQYPMMDTITEAVIKKYQDSSCSALRAQHSGSHTTKVQEAIILQLKKDPKMRAAFLNRVAGPIANRLFDCGIIP